MVRISRLHGCQLNPNDKQLNAIIRQIEKCGGYCPCVTERNEDTKCPCKNYRETGDCHCRLYLHPEKEEISMFNFSE